MAVAEERVDELHRRLLGGYRLLQALVGIRLRSVADPESRRHLAWLSDIAAGMELLSRRMTLEGPIDFAAYLEDVVGFWSRVCEGRPIQLTARGQPGLLPEGHMLPLAIVLHELIANACRHAFPDGRPGSIVISLSRATGGVSLLVRDSGIGGAEIEFGEGLRLVAGLVEHLGGAMLIESAPGSGVGVRIRLPLEDATAH